MQQKKLHEHATTHNARFAGEMFVNSFVTSIKTGMCPYLISRLTCATLMRRYACKNRRWMGEPSDPPLRVTLPGTGEKNRVPNRSTQRVELNFVAEGILDSGTVGTRDSGPGTVARYGSSNCPRVFLLESEILDCSVVRVFVLRWMEQCYHSLVPSTGTSRKLPWGSTKLVIVLTKRFGT
jgi:hypothetical protein